MKQISPRSIILLVMFAFMTIFSCKKNKAKTEEPQNSSCRIITISDDTEHSVTSYFYNEAGKVIKILSGNIVKTIEYSGEAVIMNTTKSGNFQSKSIIKLNSKGYIISARIDFNEAGTEWGEDVFEYNGGTQIIKQITTYSSNTTPEIQTYTWDKDNLISIQRRSVKMTYSYYTDKPKQPGESFSLAEFKAYGNAAKVFGNKNAVKTIELAGEIATYIYETDEDDKIISMKIQYGTNPVQTTNYQYQCK